MAGFLASCWALTCNPPRAEGAVLTGHSSRDPRRGLRPWACPLPCLTLLKEPVLCLLRARQLHGQQPWHPVPPGEQNVSIRAKAASHTLSAGEAGGSPDLEPVVRLVISGPASSLAYAHLHLGRLRCSLCDVSWCLCDCEAESPQASSTGWLHWPPGVQATRASP